MILLWKVHSQNYSYLPLMLEMFKAWSMLVVSPDILNTFVSLRLQAKKTLMMKPSYSRCKCYPALISPSLILT